MNNFLCLQAMDQGGIVFDAAMQRWHALQFSYGDHWVPSVRNSQIKVEYKQKNKQFMSRKYLVLSRVVSTNTPPPLFFDFSNSSPCGGL